VKGRTVVTLQCPAASDGTSLLTAAQLRALGDGVASRL
jgi:hypothetical protein